MVEVRHLLAHDAAQQAVEAHRQRDASAERRGLDAVSRVHEDDSRYPRRPGEALPGLERGDLELRGRKLGLPDDRSASNGNRFVEQLDARDRPKC